MRNVTKCLLLLALLMQLVGCRGCSQTSAPKTQAELDKEKEEAKKKQRILAQELQAMPAGAAIAGDTDQANFVKPGHWYQANVKLRANLEDESLTASMMIQNREGVAAPFAPGQPPVEFNRNLSLAKKQDKNIRMMFLQPEVATTGQAQEDSTATSMAMLRLTQRTVGTTLNERLSSGKTLDGYQYNLVLLSRDPARYAFWRNLDCIIWSSRSRFTNERIAPHLVIDMNEDQVASQFPDRLYAMTSISHLVINDSSLSIMTPEQQSAVLDWLYFGGTIILNGPDCIAGVETSFLKPLAPVINTSSSQLSDEEIESLNEGWSIPQTSGKRVPFAPTGPIAILRGDLNEGADWVPFQANGEQRWLKGLIAEKMVGRGRIVMTTFPMSDAAFTRWPSYSSLIHNAILRKPYRDVTSGEDPDTKYAGKMQNTEQNPVHSTRLRLWARDLDATTAEQKPKKSTSQIKEEPLADDASGERQATETKRSSLGGWNPEALILKSSRMILQESSGISVPKISTIIRLLAGYLFVLVPLNWLVFRMFGRVELAWVAAPVIALVGAFVVARSVQLDVGFSRSQTSQGFLECHAGHSRGVLSKFTALYTSLSTSYSATFENEIGIVLPLASSSGSSRSRRPQGSANKIEYWFSGESGSGMPSFSILSNTTGLLQSEEMLDTRGSVDAIISEDLSRVTLKNSMGFAIRNVGLIGRDSEGRLVTGWLGTCDASGPSEAKLEVQADGKKWRQEWDRDPIFAAPNVLRADDSMWTDRELGDELYLGGVFSSVLQAYPLEKGEMIAIGWTDQPLGGLRIMPEARQKKEKNVVLLHLRAGELESARPDVKIFQENKLSGPE